MSNYKNQIKKLINNNKFLNYIETFILIKKYVIF